MSELGTSPTVAFQGALGAFSEEAVHAFFGDAVTPLPQRTFREVGQAVRSGAAEFGMLPIENTLAGSVVGSLDLLSDGGLEVVGEVVRRIRHCLLGIEGSSLSTLRRCLSHPVALAQCTRFFSEHPELEAVAVYDTAGAADEVRQEGDGSQAAIASKSAADHYGLVVLAEDIQDRDDNQTRFVIVGREASDGDPVLPDEGGGPTDYKLMILFETKDESGALMKVLRSFADYNVNLCKLESRPGTEPWTYRFFVELLASSDRTEDVSRSLEEAQRFARSFHVLGRFAAQVSSDGI